MTILGKTLFSILNDEYYEELIFQYSFSTGKFGFRVKWEVSISPVKWFGPLTIKFPHHIENQSKLVFSGEEKSGENIY